MNFVTKLNSAVVVDRPGLQALKSTDLSSALAQIYSYGLPVKIVDSASQFFSMKNLTHVLEDETKYDELVIILEKHGMDLSIEESALIKSYHELKKKISTANRASRSYPFAKVPDGWSVEENLQIHSRAITRRGSSYSISHKVLKNVWVVASKYWADMSTVTTISEVRASGYTRSAKVSKNSVRIGCQDIERFELEQVALHFGWEFPEKD